MELFTDGAIQEKIKAAAARKRLKKAAQLELNGPSLKKYAKRGKFRFEDLSKRAIECVSNLLPPALGEDTVIEERASAKKLSEDFSAESLAAIIAASQVLLRRQKSTGQHTMSKAVKVQSP